MKNNFLSKIQDMLGNKLSDQSPNVALPENTEIDPLWDEYRQKILDTAINNGVDIALLNPDYPHFQLEKIIHYAKDGKDISFLTCGSFNSPEEMKLAEQRHDNIVKRESIYKEINTIAGEKNNSFSKKNIGFALSATIKQHSNMPLSELLVNLERAEKQLYFKYHPSQEFENDAAADEFFYLNRGALKATEELTGLNTKDIESHYIYEAQKGYFEGHYDMISYYEKIAFGDWHPIETASYIEKGDYILDKSSPDYLDYKKRQISLTIDKICENYPEDIYSWIASSHPEYMNDFIDKLEHMHTNQNKISLGQGAVDRLASRTTRHPSPKTHFEL